MENIKKYSHQLHLFLQKIRHKIILENIVINLLFFIKYFPIYLISTLLIENMFYLCPGHRKIIWLSYSTIIILLGLFLLFKIIIINFGWSKKYHQKRITKIFSEINPDLGNKFLDSLQLMHEIKTEKSGFSNELILESIKSTVNEIKSISLKNIIHKKQLVHRLKITFIFLIFSNFILLFNYNSLSHSFQRIVNFSQHYIVPTPFSITIINEKENIFGGDTVLIKIETKGKFPKELNLNLNYVDFISEKFITIDSSGFGEHPIFSVTKDFSYEVFLENRSIFKPWRKISSGIKYIKVKDRPEILNISTRIQYPQYTEINEKINESNNSEYFVMPGSKIFLEAQLNKPVSQAILNFKNIDDLNMTIQQNKIFIDFLITKEDEYKFHIIDANGIININPITYKIKINPDYYPTVNLLTPREDFQLSERMEIPIHVRISDDFGFGNSFIHYKLLKKFSEQKNIENKVKFPIENKNITLQEVSYLWEINNLRLAPEDGVEFFIEIYDNDVISGPKKTITRKITAFFPSLNDLFKNLEKEQNQVEQDGEEILSKLLSSKEILKDISNKLIKNPKLSWEQKSQLQKEINKTKEADKELKKLAEQMDKIQKQGEENQLFSDETLKKYSELQKSFQELMTPELSKAMKELQKAIDKMDKQNIQKAVDKFKSTHDDFSKELDRMLKLMKRVKIEQSIDELVKRIEDLKKRQNSITQNIKQNRLKENKDWNNLQKEEKNIEKDSQIFEDKLEKTAKTMEEFPLMNQKILENILQKMLESGLYQDLQNSQKSMQMRDSQKTQQNSEDAQQKLSELNDNMKDFQKQFQQNNMAEVESDFRKIISKSLELSQVQEELNQKITGTSRLSDQLSALAKKQNRNRQNLSRLIKEMSELSQKTFGLSSKSTKNIGQAANEMQKSISNMEERNTYSAAKHGIKARTALNKLSLNMMNSLEDLQKSGESSGFQNYMKKMEKMAKQQQGLNSDTEKMGDGMPKPMPGGKQQSLQQLAGRQRQIQQSLQQLQKEIEESASNQAGTLKGIAKDMNEIIRDLNKNKILRKTIERQSKILTRMLEAQKSLRTQSYKKERESLSGKNIYRIAPGDLPKDLGERNKFLNQKLEEALQNGYSSQYIDVIKQYFEELAKEENKNEK